MNINVKYIANDNFLSKEDVFEVIEIKEFPFNNKCYKLKGLKHWFNINDFIVFEKEKIKMVKLDIIKFNRELSRIYGKGGSPDEMWAKWCELTYVYFEGVGKVEHLQRP